MIRKIRLSVALFVANYLPPRKRQPSRIALFRALLAPIAAQEAGYVTFRNAAYLAARVTGETASLQWYLNELYDFAPRRILLATAPPAGILAGIVVMEPTMYFVAGREDTEPTAFQVVGLRSEAPVFGEYDFVVKRPLALAGNDGSIAKTVNSYRAAGKLFKIIDL